jgi:hypothetical protein
MIDFIWMYIVAVVAIGFLGLYLRQLRVSKKLRADLEQERKYNMDYFHKVNDAYREIAHLKMHNCELVAQLDKDNPGNMGAGWIR